MSIELKELNKIIEGRNMIYLILILLFFHLIKSSSMECIIYGIIVLH